MVRDYYCFGNNGDKKMEIEIHVLVRMPDGQVKYLPLVDTRPFEDSKFPNIKQDSKRHAYDWVEFILPGRARYYAVKEDGTKEEV